MAIEYDLAVLGGTPEGIYAAAQAAQRGARVALVQQGLDGRRSPLQIDGVCHSMHIWHQQTLSEMPLTPWQWATQRANLVADTLSREDYQRLLVRGCDVIAETGQVIGDRPLTIATSSRQLTTRAILLATGSVAAPPQLVNAVPYETPESLLRREVLPESVMILGGAPAALPLCQWLRRCGVRVTLLTAQRRLLGQEDPDVSQWMTAQLGAEGVDVKLEAAVTEVFGDHSRITVKLDQATVTADILVVAAKTVPHLADLGLERWFASDRPPAVNAFMQTQHPRIFACGSVLGGYDAPAIAYQEAQIAVENALFWNRRRIDYRLLPYTLPTLPEMARVGLTEAQARRLYSEDELLIAKQALYDHPKAQWRESTTGFCKLIACRSGAVLGLHGVGPEASEWVQAMSWLMSQQTPWWELAQSAALPYSLLALLPQVSQQWERDRWQPGQWRRNWSENWCNWRRSR